MNIVHELDFDNERAVKSDNEFRDRMFSVYMYKKGCRPDRLPHPGVNTGGAHHPPLP